MQSKIRDYSVITKLQKEITLLKVRKAKIESELSEKQNQVKHLDIAIKKQIHKVASRYY